MIKNLEKLKRIVARDSKVIMTTTRVNYPLVIEKGNGDYAYDAAGNRFIDFSSFISVYNFGVNANAQIRSAVKKQVDVMMHTAFNDYYSELPVVFAEKLVKMFPGGFGKVFFSNSGTEANEAALKFSKIFTKKQYALSFYNSFHGRTYGSLGLTASFTVHRENFGPFNSVIHTPFPYCYRCKLNDGSKCCLESVDNIENNILQKETSGKEIAAVFLEPIQGEGGYIVPPKEFVKELRRITKDNGILLVSDEVQAGYMRTGKFLALDNFGVDADIYTMAKAIAGGIPMGVTISKKSLGDIPEGSHSNTFGGNLVAVAAANASIDYVRRNQRSLELSAKKKGKKIMTRLNELKERYEIVGDVRGLGLMIGVEFVKSKKTKEYATIERDRILKLCFNEGLILLPAGRSAIRLIPPLTMSMQNIEKGLDILESAIKEISSG
ncbi:MAG: aminotransferase class III-fold pyridoxal phosphate-dependent enzyme [Candidatus Marsarchaeota archaeon]|jgi:4-aminobutyrate aminotransferase|nr:aminotransferase class III-fold pyridoxal phosphate-dependent enzyme [Candidatus Marsarchaeota archaeon]